MREIGRECERQQWTWGFGGSVGGMHYIIFKPVAHSEIKLKQNTETARNSFRLVSASLAYFQHTTKYDSKVKNNMLINVNRLNVLMRPKIVSVFCFSFISQCATGLTTCSVRQRSLYVS